MPLQNSLPKLALALIALVTLGCARRDSGQQVVTLWHQMRPEDRAVLESRVEAFEAEHPGVDVRPLYKETEELRSGLESAVLVGHGPDLVYGPSDPLGVYQAIGALRDLSPYFEAAEQEAFDPVALIRLPAHKDPTKSQLVFVGDRFGNHLALIYNRKFVPKPPETTVELLEIAKQNTVDEDGDGRFERYGLAWNYTEPFFLVPFLTGHGGWLFKEPRPEGAAEVPTLDTPEIIAGLRYVASLKKAQVLPRSADYEAAAALFLAGKAAMLIDGDWSWQKYLSEPGLDAAIAVLPMVSETGKPLAPMVAPKGYSMSVAVSDARAPLVAEVVKFLTNEETQRAFLKQSILPSRLALRSDPAVVDDPTMQVSLAQVERGRLMPTATEQRAVWDAMRPHYQALMAGEMTPEAAAAAMQRDAVSKIATLTSRVEPDATAGLVKLLGGVLLAGLVYVNRRTLVDFARDWRRNRFAYILVLPALAVIFLTVIFPLAYNVLLSFSNMSLQNFRDWQIVGLHNYVSLLTGGESSRFWNVFGKTLLWTVINVSLHVAIGVLLAITLNGPVRGKSLYRILLIIPWAVPAYITALTWRGMFDDQFGAVNHLLASWGIGTINWLTQEGPAFAACIIANVWLGFPFMMMIALGGLQGIPKELYEAAAIDRVSRWNQFWHITLPMLKPVLLPAITLGAVWTFNNLNVVWLVSKGGEPSDKTHILVSYVYKAVFNLYQYGYGAALSMVIFAMLLTFSVLFLGRTKATEAVA